LYRQYEFSLFFLGFWNREICSMGRKLSSGKFGNRPNRMILPQNTKIASSHPTPESAVMAQVSQIDQPTWY